MIFSRLYNTRAKYLTPPYKWNEIFFACLTHRRELVVAQTVAILGVIAGVPIPLLLPLLVDEVLLGHGGPVVATVQAFFPVSWHGPTLYICVVLIIALLLRLIALLMQVWQSRQFTTIAKDLTLTLRENLLAHLTRVSMAEYETLGSGGVASQLVTDVDAVDRFLGAGLSKLLVAVLSLVGTAAVLVWIHWPLALFILVMNPLVIYTTTILGRRVKQLKRRENGAYEDFQQTLTETLDGMQQIRASQREEWFFARLTARAKAVRDSAVAYEWRGETANRLSFLVFLFGFDGFRALAMLTVVYSDLSMGQMMAVFGYLWFMMTPVQEIVNLQYAWAAADGALGRINRLLELQQEPDYPTLADPFIGQRAVSVGLERVSFSYGEGPKILDEVTLEIAPGERIALVGASGAGKSTLTQVLVGLYPPDSGVVRFGGVPVEHIGLPLIRRQVATVLQQPVLFNDTIRLNLTLGQDQSESRLWEALEVAQLDGFVGQLPEGLDTIVGRSGVRLSGGQRQRLAIARLVLTDPKVVILDEATSSLDTVTEEALHQSLRRFLIGRTTLIIAHRLSAVRQADRVYVFDGGRIVEQGCHEALIAAGGLYQRLYGD